MKAYTDKLVRVDPRYRLYRDINGDDKGRKKAARRIGKEEINNET